MTDNMLGPGDKSVSNETQDLSPQWVKDQPSVYFVKIFSLYSFFTCLFHMLIKVLNFSYSFKSFDLLQKCLGLVEGVFGSSSPGFVEQVVGYSLQVVIDFD